MEHGTSTGSSDPCLIRPGGQDTGCRSFNSSTSHRWKVEAGEAGARTPAVGGPGPGRAAIRQPTAQLHASGLIHKDIKPGNLLVSPRTSTVWLTGFGIAS